MPLHMALKNPWAQVSLYPDIPALFKSRPDLALWYHKTTLPQMRADILKFLQNNYIEAAP